MSASDHPAAASAPTVDALREEDVDAAVAFDGSYYALSRLKLEMRDGMLWCDLESFDTEQIEQGYRKLYGDDADADGLRDYLQRARGNTAPDAAAFVARIDGRVVGRLLMSRTWNGFAYIEDIAIDRDVRRRGAGSALMRQALAWAREHGYPGIMLETQDTNVLACRLYLRHGFVLGGCDRFHYANEEEPELAQETALFWYHRF
ncbi:GNAT family N-acetyltransferase [Lysobacter sp. K5869]|uniref:GNAT family N-acetyltransferase n=1 Tax=Lysobacter sp. K5869 TaxID=2820808 RepID=UPI001C060591|nr:GNAT family N-acetyltransferase [Lysobacter sp. K5869]QWP76364.1 GNAT family N-acetyltransferase [Lysobacter sp. K5869]